MLEHKFLEMNAYSEFETCSAYLRFAVRPRFL